MTPAENAKNLIFPGGVLNPAQLTGDVNDYNPGAGGTWLLTSDASRAITGIAATKINGFPLVLVNTGANDIVLTNNSGASAAGNKIITNTGADITLVPLSAALLVRDEVNSVWRATLLGGGASSGGGGLSIYGTGAAGSGTLDGAATVFGLAPAANVYTAVADIYAADLTINTGIALHMNGFRLFVSGTLTLSGTAHVHNDGNAGAAAGTAGAATSNAGTLGFGTAGGAGGVAAGSGGTPESGVAGGAGAAGGAGSGGAGGAGGTATPVSAAQGGTTLPSAVPYALTGIIHASTGRFDGGTGGGGGGGDGTAGGGGGGGGGALVVAAQTLAGTGTISADGGDGGTPAAGNRGGGGGGGGGVVSLISNSGLGTVTLSAAGGTAGAGSGTGAAGTNGAAGGAFDIPNA